MTFYYFHRLSIVDIPVLYILNIVSQKKAIIKIFCFAKLNINFYTNNFIFKTFN